MSLRHTALLLAFAACAAAQTSAPPLKASKGLPPRNNAAEYLSRGQIGKVQVGAEFDRHSVPTADSILTTEHFVAVEIGLFGAPGDHLAISYGDFSLNINGKKNPLPTEQYAAVFKNLRDPNWTSPEEIKAKEDKQSGGGGSGLTTNNTQTDNMNMPVIVHIPPEMEKAMATSVTNAALPEGDRQLPIAGLLFFAYSGDAKGIKTVELVYNGPAGKATIPLQR